MEQHVIKVRYKSPALAFVLALLLCLPAKSQGAGCDKTPRDQYAAKTDGNNGFAIQINGSPRLYRPNQIYTITLKSIAEAQVTKFTGFLLVAESGENQKRSSGMPVNLGTLQLMPGEAMTKFSHKCSNAIEATSSISKEQIQVYWTSPPRGSGCVQFTAMVIERQDVWYMDDAGLTYTLCEDNSPLAEPPVVEPCCACDEAKYEVIFEGIWSRHTHPKDFPKDEWRTQFSKLIGASHSVNYTLWEYGRHASGHLQYLAEHGITRRLETEMKSYSRDIRSVIKAHGLQQRSNVVGQTFAVFRVDPVHHLLSLVSKMIPSPDWIVGLSKENLCLADCTWVPSRVIDLYPWDIGTQSGLSYDSPPSIQRPKGVIQRITSTNPNAEESPFFDPTGAPMKPAARLHIIRQREYRKVCAGKASRQGGPERDLNPSWSGSNYGGFGGVESGGSETGDDSYIYKGEGIGKQTGTDYGDLDLYDNGTPGDSGFNPCEASDWGPWSDCSATCGPASRSRSRTYSDESAAEENQCNEQLIEKEPCRNRARCPPKNYGGSFQPFAVGEEDTSIPGYSSPWVTRGLESDGLRAPNSYHYETGKGQKVPNFYFGNNNRGGNLKQATQSDSYNQRGNGRSANRPYNDYPGDVLSYSYGGSENTSPYNRQASQSSPSTSQESVSDDNERYTTNQESEPETEEVDCSLSEWGEWSDCSSDCDRGTRTRLRRYNNPQMSSSCTAELDGMEPCHGRGAMCPRGFDRIEETTKPQTVYEDETEEVEVDTEEPVEELPPSVKLGVGYRKPHYKEDHEKCATSDWSEWSPCSLSCGEGAFKTRTRLFLIPFVEDRSCDLRLIETQSCNVPRCFNNYYNLPNAENLHGNSYSPSVTKYRDDLESYYDDEDLTSHLSSTNSNNNDNNLENEEASDPEPEEERPPRPQRCFLKPNRGYCSGSGVFPRWYYDSDTDNCKMFTYYGCNGNKNNFVDEDMCLKVCGPERTLEGINEDNLNGRDQSGWNQNVHEDNLNGRDQSGWNQNVHEDATYAERRRADAYSKLKTLNLMKESSYNHRDQDPVEDFQSEVDEPEDVFAPEPFDFNQPHYSEPQIDCIVSSWSEWSQCSSTCGIGWTKRDREVIIQPDNGGKKCPKKLNRKRKCRIMPCPADTKYWYHGSWRHMAGYEDDSNVGSNF